MMKLFRRLYIRFTGRCPNCNNKFSCWFEWEGQNFCYPCLKTYGILYREDGSKEKRGNHER